MSFANGWALDVLDVLQAATYSFFRTKSRRLRTERGVTGPGLSEMASEMASEMTWQQRVMLARQQVQQGNAEAALGNVTAALEMAPDCALAWFVKAQIHASRRESDLASHGFYMTLQKTTDSKLTHAARLNLPLMVQKILPARLFALLNDTAFARRLAAAIAAAAAEASAPLLVVVAGARGAGVLLADVAANCGAAAVAKVLLLESSALLSAVGADCLQRAAPPASTVRLVPTASMTRLDVDGIHGGTPRLLVFEPLLLEPLTTSSVDRVFFCTNVPGSTPTAP